jgi:hypothetical protein
MCSSIIININGFNIMVTLGVYFEYIKILFKIFTKYIVPYYKFIQTILLLFQIIKNDIYYHSYIFY